MSKFIQVNRLIFVNDKYKLSAQDCLINADKIKSISPLPLEHSCMPAFIDTPICCHIQCEDEMFYVYGSFGDLKIKLGIE